MRPRFDSGAAETSLHNWRPGEVVAEFAPEVEFGFVVEAREWFVWSNASQHHEAGRFEVESFYHEDRYEQACEVAQQFAERHRVKTRVRRVKR